MQGATPCIPVFCIRWLHHRVQNVDEFLSLRAAAEAKGAGSQQPVAQENVTAFDLVHTRDVLKVDNLVVLATKHTFFERLDPVEIDPDVFKSARTLVLEQQRVVVHARHSREVR